MNDPWNLIALCLTVILGLPAAIEGYQRLFKREKKPRDKSNK